MRAAQPYKESHFELAAQRSDVLRMMSNESPFAPSPRILAAILDAATSGNLYPPGRSVWRPALAGPKAPAGPPSRARSAGKAAPTTMARPTQPPSTRRVRRDRVPCSAVGPSPMSTRHHGRGVEGHMRPNSWT